MNDSRNSWLLAAVCLPLVAFFGWVMTQRLAACPKGIRADFVQEWTSARNYLTGRPIYSPLNESFPTYFGPKATTELKVNAHPPVAVLVALPFGYLNYKTAWLVWNISSLSLLAVSLFLLMRPSGLNYSAASTVVVTALLLVGNPLPQQVIEGQMNLLLLALLVGAWAADRQDRFKLAGSLIGLAAAIKLYPAFMVVYFLATRRWQAVIFCGLSFVICNLVAVAIFGFDVFTIYVRDVLPAFAHYGNNIANTSLHGLLSTIFVGMRGLSDPLVDLPAAEKLVRIPCVLLVAALCGWKAWRATDQADRDLAFAACLTGMLLASPITWGHSFVLLVAPLLIMWRYASQPTTHWLIAALITMLWLVRPGWIWNPLVPGFEAFSLGIAPASYRVPAVYAVTVLSFLTYALMAFFALTVTVSQPSEDESAYRS